MDILTESDFVHSLHVYSQSMIRQPPEIATRLENPRRNNIILDGELSCDLQTIQLTWYTGSRRVNNWWTLLSQHR